MNSDQFSLFQKAAPASGKLHPGLSECGGYNSVKWGLKSQQGLSMERKDSSLALMEQLLGAKSPALGIQVRIRCRSSP